MRSSDRQDTPSTLRITFDANPLAHATKSGVGYFTHGLIQAMASMSNVHLTGYYFNFLGRKQVGGLPAGAHVSYKEIRYFPTKILNVLRRLRIELPIELFVRQKADVLLFPNFIAQPTLRGTRRAVVVHDLSFIDHPEYVSARNRSFLQAWVPRHARRANTIITVSEFTKQRLIDAYGLPADKIHVMPIPPTEHVAADEQIIDKYSLRQGYLLFVGNIEPRKNISGLLAAYEQLPREVTDAYPLVLVGGKGWNDDEILMQLERAKQKGIRIVQTGYVSDAEKAALFQHATVFVQAAYYEGFGMPVLEAMSYGLPVACSNIPAFHEVADNAAVFFNPHDPAEIAEVLNTVLQSESKRKALAQASRERVARYKDWSAVAAEVVAWLDEDRNNK